MKRIIIVAMLISCIACNKTDNNNPSKNSANNNQTGQWGESVMTISDNGKTYKIESDAVGCQNFNDFDGASCFLKVADHPNSHEVTLSFMGEKQGSDRVGEYLYHRDPNENLPSYYYIVKGATEDDNIFWGVDSSIIDITSSVRKEDFSDLIRDKGTFKAWISREEKGKTLTKIITGEFDCW